MMNAEAEIAFVLGRNRPRGPSLLIANIGGHHSADAVTEAPQRLQTLGLVVTDADKRLRLDGARAAEIPRKAARGSGGHAKAQSLGRSSDNAFHETPRLIHAAGLDRPFAHGAGGWGGARNPSLKPSASLTLTPAPETPTRSFRHSELRQVTTSIQPPKGATLIGAEIIPASDSDQQFAAIVDQADIVASTARWIAEAAFRQDTTWLRLYHAVGLMEHIRVAAPIDGGRA
jgi:hypothetical protein